MSHMSARGSIEFMKASVDEGVQDTAWFLLLCAIHRYKPGLKKARAVFSYAAGRGVWHSLFEARRQEGNKQIKFERLSFGKI